MTAFREFVLLVLGLKLLLPLLILTMLLCACAGKVDGKLCLPNDTRVCEDLNGVPPVAPIGLRLNAETRSAAL